ncbi:protein DMP7-like [Aegilops tauschii subsp. strangulata]|uniref:Uncharacterized protein n=1 Tax=Aegilops tauschii TaxID=37682 RepID=N1R506_AEGTA|nr:protein DMP7-like [Aegilops tauschii subsp. strangulata]
MEIARDISEKEMATPAPPQAVGDVEAQDRKGAPADSKTPVNQKVLSVSANLAQLLPTGSVMAYQMLAPSFSNQGKCYSSKWWITLGLVVVLAASCIFFALTDTVLHDGKVYYGLAIYGRLNIFNLSKKEEEKMFTRIQPVLKERGLKKRDLVHASLTVVVFLTMVFSDVGLQNCFFPDAGTDTQQLLKNLPLGMAVFSSLVFTIFPSKRNFIGCSDPNSDKNNDTAKTEPSSDAQPPATQPSSAACSTCGRCS